MKRLMFVAVATAAMAAVAKTGVWTQRQTLDGYTPYATAGNWQDDYVPNQANDSVDLSAFSSSSNDRGWWYGTPHSVFQNIALPAASSELLLDDIVGGRQNRLRGASNAKDLYSFLNMSRYLGSIQLYRTSELRLRVAANETQELHKLVVNGTPALKVEDGVVELGNLCGVGTLVKTGAGELRLSGVTSANGVRLKVSEGQLTLKGVPENPAPAGDPAAHFDFSDASTLTVEDGGVAQAADVRGPGYHTLTPLWGARTPIVKYGDLQLLNFGYDSTGSASDSAVWGGFGGMQCDATIDHVRTMFVVYRYNSSDFNGAAAFPVNSQSGNDMRRPPDTIDTNVSADKNANVSKLCDWSAYNLFFYQQYSAVYQCYASQFIVTGDIRRNGEPVVYNETPRGFRDELEVMSFNFNTNHLVSTGLNEWNFKYVARAQDEGPTGGSQIGEILVYTNALTDAEQKQTIDYLMAKWGKVEGKRPWIASSVGGALKTTVNVPAGETAYVKAIDTTSGALVKTGEGKLVARQVDGDGVIKVEGGSVEFVGGLKPVESGKGEFLPAPGMNAHFDASVTDGMVFDSDGKGIVRWNSSVTNNRNADYNEYLAVTNDSGKELTGMIPFRTTDADGRSWVDFGALTASSSKATDTPSSGWLRVGRPSTRLDNNYNHVREVFWVWKTRPAADGTNPILIGSGASDWWRYARPGKGVMLNNASVYGSSDGNYTKFWEVLKSQWAIDGKVVDPTKANYPSDVHVVRVSYPTAAYFCGVGNDDFYSKGGFQLGELITYSRELTDRERVDTETYLLRKWTDKDHPDYVGAAPTAAKVLYPAGVTDIAADEGAVVQVDKMVSDEAEPTFFSGSTVGIHLDASRIDCLSVTERADGSSGCSKIDDPRNNGKSGAPSNKNRPPKVLPYYLNGKTVLDLGQKGDYNAANTDTTDILFDLNGLSSVEQVAAIVVYSNQPNSDQYANMLRCNQWWGEGSLFTTGGATSFFKKDGCVDRASNGTVWIDGTNIGTTTAEGTAMPAGFHVVVFNYSQNGGWVTDGIAGSNANSSNSGGMLFCEAITFKSRLTTAQVTEATTYLMKKWGIGQTVAEPPELSSISAAKGGTVKLAMAVNATTLSGAGTIDAPAVNGVDTINAKLLADSVEGPTLTGTLSLAATGVINVTLGEGVAKPQPGVYPIVSGATLASDTAEKLKSWTLNVPEIKGRTFALKVVDGTICLDVRPTGMMVIIQ